MRFQYTPYFAVLAVTALVSAGVAFVSWQRRSTAARTSFALMMMAVAQYATVAALEAAAIALPDKIFWSKLEYVGSEGAITSFLVFTAYFTGHNKWFTWRNILLLWVIPIFNVALVATNEFHSLVWSGFSPGPRGSNLIIYQHGPGFLWIMVWAYVYVLVGVFLLAKAALRRSTLYRRQASTLLVGSLIPLMGGTLYMLGLTPPGLNITPMSFMLTGLVCFGSIFRFRMFDLVPVARDTLIESMSDGVLVLDIKNRIVDINPAVQNFIGKSEGYIGKSADEVLARWSYIAQLCHCNEESRAEVLMNLDTPRYVDLRISPLRDRRGRLTGRLVVFRDITQRYQAETDLRKANDRLKSQLVAIKSLQAKLQEQASRDKLTGLYNRRHFDETFPKELARSRRRNYLLALIIMDIDYFKKINDTFGHQAGDRVLQAFGELLSSHVRPCDIACRFGGEEFVLALPCTSSESVYEGIEQIRLSFQALRVQWEEIEIVATVSGGIAIYPKDAQTQDELLQVADKALYAAKAAGRNCIKFG